MVCQYLWVSAWNYSVCISRSGIEGSYGNSNFWRNHCTVSAVCIILHSHQQCMKLSISPHPHYACYFLFVWFFILAVTMFILLLLVFGVFLVWGYCKQCWSGHYYASFLEQTRIHFHCPYIWNWDCAQDTCMFNFGKCPIVFQSVYTNVHSINTYPSSWCTWCVRIFNFGHLVDIEWKLLLAWIFIIINEVEHFFIHLLATWYLLLWTAYWIMNNLFNNLVHFPPSAPSVIFLWSFELHICHGKLFIIYMHCKDIIYCLCVLSELFYQMPIQASSNIYFWFCFFVHTEDNNIIYTFLYLALFLWRVSPISTRSAFSHFCIAIKYFTVWLCHCDSSPLMIKGPPYVTPVYK